MDYNITGALDLNFIHSYLTSCGVGERAAAFVTALTGVLLIMLLSTIAGVLCARFLLRWIKHLIKRSRSDVDDLLVEFKVLDKFFLLVPVFVFYLMSTHLLDAQETLSRFLAHLSGVCMIAVMVIALDATLDMVLVLFNRFKIAVAFPVKSFVQVVKVIIYLIGAILIIATLVGKTPVYILSGMGALTAVLMLVFKDAILGFVAGIQLTKNDMVRIGDWIEMPKYGADGDVIDLALTTVKVCNFDKTVTSVPTYALISDSFKNWRPMSESGGRRIKRALYLDMNSVCFCDEEMLQRFSRIQYITEYIERKKQEITRYNDELKVDPASLANGRRMTNLGVLRAYMEAYLRNNPRINHEMITMVRQLEPTPQGVPVEVYCFSADKIWVNYEGIQADIFDHFIAVVQEFDLRLFQNPTGSDFLRVLKI